MNNRIDKNISIEELVEILPASVAFLREKGIVCILCGEPAWGTFAELATAKGFSNEDIDQLVAVLNAMI